MKTVREEMLAAAAGPSVTGIILDQVECAVWKRYDELHAQGKLVLWGFLDASGVVERALRAIFGERPAGCP